MNRPNIIELKDLTKNYGSKTRVIEGLNLEIKQGEFVTLLGPSGCGKTTLLRLIGGFEKPTEGRIFLHGQDITAIPPYERPINTVFQRYALFPFLNVYDNVAFGLKIRKLPGDEVTRKVNEALRVVDLEGFGKRRISTLSGGQQQRVAIARAIVNEPEILLLDEPLSALDYKMRQEMQLELRDMQEELGITFVFVTHDQEEAMTMSDRIVVLSDGEIQQTGTPEEIYKSPRNIFVADFIGNSNIFDGYITGMGEAAFLNSIFACRTPYEAGTRIRAVIRPEHVFITDPENAGLKGRVISSIFKGDCYEVTVASDKNEIVAHDISGLSRGSEVGIDFPAEHIHLLLEDSRQNHFSGIVAEDGRLYIEEGISLPVSFASEYIGSEVEAYFSPEDARMSDNTEEGFATGNIVSAIYVGSHYMYTIRSKNDVDYTVDDEWLWNIGDLVSIVVSEDKIHYEMRER